MPAWCSSVSAIARSAWRSARGVGRRRLGQRPAERVDHEGVRLLAPAGTSPPRRPRTPRRRRRPRSRRGARARRTRRTRPAAAPGPRRAAASGGRRAGWRARRAPGSASSSASSLQSRLKTPGAARRCRTAARPRRTRAPRRRARRRARAGAGARRPSRPPVTVSRSLRPSCRTRLRRKNGSSRPPKRLRARRTPLAIAPTLPALRGIEMQDAVGLAVAQRAQDDRLGPSPGRARHPSLYFVK